MLRFIKLITLLSLSVISISNHLCFYPPTCNMEKCFWFKLSGGMKSRMSCSSKHWVERGTAPGSPSTWCCAVLLELRSHLAPHRGCGSDLPEQRSASFALPTACAHANLPSHALGAGRRANPLFLPLLICACACRRQHWAFAQEGLAGRSASPHGDGFIFTLVSERQLSLVGNRSVRTSPPSALNVLSIPCKNKFLIKPLKFIKTTPCPQLYLSTCSFHWKTNLFFFFFVRNLYFNICQNFWNIAVLVILQCIRLCSWLRVRGRRSQC